MLRKSARRPDSTDGIAGQPSYQPRMNQALKTNNMTRLAPAFARSDVWSSLAGESGRKRCTRSTLCWRVGAARCCPPLAVRPPSLAQQWPQRPVKFILPLGPGSGADISARLFADRLSPSAGASRWWSRTGPAPTASWRSTRSSAPRDDHTLLFGPSSSFVGHPYLHDKMPYDPRDLVADRPRVQHPGERRGAAVAQRRLASRSCWRWRARSPASSTAATITGVTDIIVDGYLKSAGIDMAKVPYRDTVQALNDLAEGRIQLYVAALGDRAAAGAGRPHQAPRDHQPRASARRAGRSDRHARPAIRSSRFDGLVGLFGPRDMAADVARAHRRRRAGGRRRSRDRGAARPPPARSCGPASAAEFAASIEAQRNAVANFAKTLGSKPSQ